MVDVFQTLQHKLNDYYSLLDQLVLNGSLDRENLIVFFDDSNLIEEIIKVSEKYGFSKKKRTCGNPAFIHIFRTLLWLKVLGADSRTMLLALYHDLLEDFGSSVRKADIEFSEVPDSISDASLVLTNRSSSMVKFLERSHNDLDMDLFSFDNSKVFSSVSSDFKSKLDSDSFDVIKKNSYVCYLDNLITYVVESGDESALFVKIADRIDNSLSDWPSKFNSIVKLYSKNELVLKSFKDLVESSSSPILKLLYALLIERSLDQLKFLIHNYGVLVEKRGPFYGSQYKVLLDRLVSEFVKLNEFEKIKNDLLSLDEVNNLFSTFDK